jgi:hypothetical protein
MKQAVFKGQMLYGYFLDKKGNIFSDKSPSGSMRRLSINVSGKSPYPAVGLYFDGKTRTIPLHQMVCETFHPFPKPSSITSTDWKKTPKSVKRLVQNNFQVNHIDHNNKNFHPSNLEWVDAKENVRKYQEHRKKSK